SHDEVLHWYPRGIRGFEGTPGAIIPRYARNSKHEWRIGETTDDTEGTVAVARAIITEGNVAHVSIGREMLRCTKSVHPGVPPLRSQQRLAVCMTSPGDCRNFDRYRRPRAAFRISPSRSCRWR